jgi:hypothetical protein
VAKWLMRGTGAARPFVSVANTALSNVRACSSSLRLPTGTRNAEEPLVRFDLEEQGVVAKVRLTHSPLISDGARAHGMAFAGFAFAHEGRRRIGQRAPQLRRGTKSS